MAHTFKVGDIVRGISADYPITNSDMARGLITAIFENSISIKVLEHVKHAWEGMTFDVVHAECFELVAPASPISRTIYSPPATVVFWSDGSKTVAKCAPHERFDREKGLAIACAKKLLGEGYADAFKEFREPKNRVLSWNEIKALPDGCKAYLEDRILSRCIGGVVMKQGDKLIYQDGGYRYLHVFQEPHGIGMRVWLLPRKPTADELRANPWKREGSE